MSKIKTYLLVVILLSFGAYLGKVFSGSYTAKTKFETQANHPVIDGLEVKSTAQNKTIVNNASSQRTLMDKLVHAVSSNHVIAIKQLAIYRVLWQVSENDTVALMATIEQLQTITEEDKSIIVLMLLSRLAEISPARSMALGEQYIDRVAEFSHTNFEISSLFVIWAKNAPQEMFEYVLQQNRSEYLRMLFRHWTPRDFLSAFSAVQALQALQENVTQALYGMVDGSQRSEHFSQLLSSVMQNQDTDLQTLFFTRWASIDAMSAARWLANNTQTDESPDKKLTVFFGLVSQDFAYAIDWYFANTNDTFLRPAFGNKNFASDIAPNQFPQVFDWLLLKKTDSSNPVPIWISVLELSIAQNAMVSQIDSVKRYLLKHNESSIHFPLNEMLYEVLAKQNMQSANEFLLESGLIDSARFMSKVEEINRNLERP